MLTKGSSEHIPESQQAFRTSGGSCDPLLSVTARIHPQTPRSHPAVRLHSSCRLSAFGIQASQASQKPAPKSLELVTVL